MKISLTDAGKRFNRDWIFRHLSYTFEPGNSYAITGPNGSGKSTLLQIISGALGINEGKIAFTHTAKNKPVEPDTAFRHISLCAPYLELIEEMTLSEFLDFHMGFKPLISGLSKEEVIRRVNLENAVHKQIRNFSSGMKQRVKLAQAIFSDIPVILLDEPCTNLDLAGIELYQQLIHTYCEDRLVVVSSNDTAEYGFCKEKIDITHWK